MKNIIVLLCLFLLGCKQEPKIFDDPIFDKEKARILKLAEKYIDATPVTVTAESCERSAGGIHDFYSEGDYWWPDPENPEGPYIRKDGMTNPNNFTAHRYAMIRLSQICGVLASAYLITDDTFYVKQLVPHLKAWFIDEATLMNPNLKYAQAIKGKVSGRGIGIIDTIQLLDVVKAIIAIQDANLLSGEEITKLKIWFADYLRWMDTHPYGVSEQAKDNNHGACWFLQAAVFSEFTENETMQAYVKQKFKEILLPCQMAEDGSFPKELNRTKPYGYSLFNLDIMTGIAQVISNANDNMFLYDYEGRSIRKGVEFLYPYVKNKEDWPYEQDVLHWDDWPVRHPFLLFTGRSLDNMEYLDVWNQLDADFDNPEVIRNMPIRYPLIWLN
ncbi:alginate lyase family protein [Flagellimonas sp. 389]|uniref:alginate lyase family protein n=1 Tax=Flagellimonas sp. 389 TaxID=2835862 RepID=UPI001BD6A6C8|nr:alginate lyase family protein [Flagellimonas sp. 389]MBS9461843.1 alginate lyase family protein [Flagellimonas sp. 389]